MQLAYRGVRFVQLSGSIVYYPAFGEKVGGAPPEFVIDNIIGELFSNLFDLYLPAPYFLFKLKRCSHICSPAPPLF